MIDELRLLGCGILFLGLLELVFWREWCGLFDVGVGEIFGLGGRLGVSIVRQG